MYHGLFMFFYTFSSKKTENHIWFCKAINCLLSIWTEEIKYLDKMYVFEKRKEISMLESGRPGIIKITEKSRLK